MPSSHRSPRTNLLALLEVPVVDDEGRERVTAEYVNVKANELKPLMLTVESQMRNKPLDKDQVDEWQVDEWFKTEAEARQKDEVNAPVDDVIKELRSSLGGTRKKIRPSGETIQTRRQIGSHLKVADENLWLAIFDDDMPHGPAERDSRRYDPNLRHAAPFHEDPERLSPAIATGLTTTSDKTASEEPSDLLPGRTDWARLWRWDQRPAEDKVENAVTNLHLPTFQYVMNRTSTDDDDDDDVPRIEPSTRSVMLQGWTSWRGLPSGGRITPSWWATNAPESEVYGPSTLSGPRRIQTLKPGQLVPKGRGRGRAPAAVPSPQPESPDRLVRGRGRAPATLPSLQSESLDRLVRVSVATPSRQTRPRGRETPSTQGSPSPQADVSGKHIIPKSAVYTPYNFQWSWLNCLFNLCPAIWLWVEYNFHVGTIIASMIIILTRPEAPFSSYKPTWRAWHYLIFLWPVLASHSLFRLAVAIGHHKRMRRVLKGRGIDRLVIWALAARDSTWLALEAADRTQAQRALESDTTTADAISDTSFWFRYWVLSPWFCCWHRRFMRPQFYNLKTEDHQAKQAAVVMWELFHDNGMFARTSIDRMKWVTLFLIWMNPFIGTPTYHWPAIMEIWKIMFWRAVADVFIFFFFLDVDCSLIGVDVASYLPSELSSLRRLASPHQDAQLQGARRDLGSEEETLRRRLQEDQQDSECNWFINVTGSMFKSPVGTANFTKGQNCSFEVALQLDLPVLPELDADGFYESLSDNWMLNGGGTSIPGNGTSSNGSAFVVESLVEEKQISEHPPGHRWNGIVLPNRDVVIPEAGRTILSQAVVSGPWPDCALVRGTYASPQTEYVSFLEQENCDVSAVMFTPEMRPQDVPLLPVILQGATFGFLSGDNLAIIDYGYVASESKDLFLYSDPMLAPVEHSKQTRIDCPICTELDYTFQAGLSSDLASCELLQNFINQGTLECSAWQDVNFEFWDSAVTSCCVYSPGCIGGAFLVVRLLAGLTTLFNLFRKWRMYKKTWNMRKCGMVKNYWGRQDFWVKWVEAVKPVWWRRMDMWIEYSKHQTADYRTQGSANVASGKRRPHRMGNVTV